MMMGAAAMQRGSRHGVRAARAAVGAAPLFYLGFEPESHGGTSSVVPE